MPSVIEELTEVLHSGVSEEGGAFLRRGFHIKDLGGTGLNRFLSVWNLLGTTLQGDGGLVTLPRDNERVIIGGREVWAKVFDVKPWGDADAILTVDYREDNTELSGFDGVEMEVGTTVEQDETDFTGEQADKPFHQRTPMYILYDPTATGRPQDTEANRKAVRLPKWVGKSFRRYTKTVGEDPGPMSEFYASRTNSTTWKGYPPETVLCMSIVARNAGRGWRATGDFAIDRTGRFRQIGRAKDETTGEPIPLTQQQVANANGIDEFRVQGSANFNALPF
jgi:hypothetical protein